MGVQSDLSIDSNIMYTYYETDDSGTNINLRIVRSANTPDIKRMMIIIDVAGDSMAPIEISESNMPSQNGKKVYSFEFNEPLGTPIRASLTSIIDVDGEETECKATISSSEIKEKQ